jgi:subtilisin family serine protease
VTAHVRRRRRLLWTLALVAALFLETAVVEPRILLIRRIETKVAGLPEEWNGGTVIQLSDPHLGYPSPAAWRAIDTVRAEGPDLVVVTGDVADRRSSIPVVLAWAKQLCEAAASRSSTFRGIMNTGASVMGRPWRGFWSSCGGRALLFWRTS